MPPPNAQPLQIPYADIVATATTPSGTIIADLIQFLEDEWSVHLLRHEQP